MNAKAFRTARQGLNRRKPFSDANNKYNELWKTLHKAAAPEHSGENIGEYMSDQIKCACGWESRGYWDGSEWAWGEWREHVANEIGLIPKTCPCGKTYLPVDGGTPCHELQPTKTKS